VIPCICCGTGLTSLGSCVSCDIQMSSPPHACLRWLTVIGDEHDDGARDFARLPEDHETAWRLDPIDGPHQDGAGS